MRTVTALLVLILSATVASAEMVRWVDETGQVHYSDEPDAIPHEQRKTSTFLEYDDAVEPKKPVAEAPPAYVAHPGGITTPLVYSAPLIAHGFSYYVDTVLDKGVKARLLLDTGATFTIISPEIGRKMGYANLNELPKMPVSTAGGGAWVYLIRIHRLAAGDARVEDIEGGISETMGEDMDGLLGGSFLNEFVYQIDGSGGKLTMKPNRDDGTLFGGRDQKWWEMKYDHYVQAIRHYRSLKKKMVAGKTGAHDKDLRATGGMTPADMQKIITYYEELHLWLERRATIANVPKNWRQYP